MHMGSNQSGLIEIERVSWVATAVVFWRGTFNRLQMLVCMYVRASSMPHSVYNIVHEKKKTSITQFKPIIIIICY
jgi:hypothetical protein